MNTEQIEISAPVATIALEAEPALQAPDQNTISTLGEQTVRQLRTLIESGVAHIVGAGVAGPPIVVAPGADQAKAKIANQSLGWELSPGNIGKPRPRGEEIGVLVYDRANHNEPVVLIFPRAALVLIQKRWGHNGHSQAATWKAVWDTEKCYPHTWTPKTRGTWVDYRVRVMVEGENFNGVPFSVASLVGGEPGVEDQDCRMKPTA